jgi:hypothetical protein
MIPKAREVRLTPKVRKVLEACALLAAEGRSTRSIAQEVGVQPRIVRK